MMRGLYRVWYEEKVVPGLIWLEGCTGSGMMGGGLYRVRYYERVVPGQV